MVVVVVLVLVEVARERSTIRAERYVIELGVTDGGGSTDRVHLLARVIALED